MGFIILYELARMRERERESVVLKRDHSYGSSRQLVSRQLLVQQSVRGIDSLKTLVSS